MTKGELFEKLKDLPDECQIDVYDMRSYDHPLFEIDTEKYYDYDNGLPIITIELT